MLEAFGRRDVEAVVALTSPDCVIVALRSRLEGAFEGHDGVRRWVKGYYEIIPDARSEIERIIPTGRNEVVALGHQSGTAPKGGAAFEAPLAALAQHDDGKLVRLVLFETHEEALAASGGAA
jgi:ketosteroid isomerase-like protein